LQTRSRTWDLPFALESSPPELIYVYLFVRRIHINLSIEKSRRETHIESNPTCHVLGQNKLAIIYYMTRMAVLGRHTVAINVRISDIFWAPTPLIINSILHKMNKFFEYKKITDKESTLGPSIHTGKLSPWAYLWLSFHSKNLYISQHREERERDSLRV